MSVYDIDELLDRLDEGRRHCGMCGAKAVERNSRGQYICNACLHEAAVRYDLVLRWDAAAEITRLRADLRKAQEREAHAGKREFEIVLGKLLSALPLDRITIAGDSVGSLIEGIRQVVRERDEAVSALAAAGIKQQNKTGANHEN